MPRARPSTRVSDKASDAEAERLAEAENKADAIGGVNLTEEPTDVADILIDLAQRETRTFSNRFARLLMGEMKHTVRMHKHPLKSAGFRVLKAPDVPSVLVELGYVSNKGDLEHLVSDKLAFPHRRIDGAGHRRLPGQTRGDGGGDELKRNPRPCWKP